MSCYHPILGIPRYDERGFNKTFKLSGPYDPIARQLYPGSVSIPCGRCIGCRLDYSRQWADRMTLEYETTGKAVFVTLTYNNDHVPCVTDEYGELIGYTLKKDHFQKFMKRLRSRKEFEDREIRFFASGEYGSQTFRPHYHAILFGLDLEDFLGIDHDKWKIQKFNELKQPIYISDSLTDIWQNGFTCISPVSWNTFAYVARYVIKKAFGEKEPVPELENEFSLMSRRPGIGSKYFEIHGINLEQLFYYAQNKKIPIPRYYKKLLEKDDPDMYNKLKEQSKDYAYDKAMRMLVNTDLEYTRVLELKEDEILKKSKCLNRNLI